tara:strand:+ start:3586 stop:3933 length:348 start_codon:yes stop_codon:yes gene_type:complete
MSMKVVIPSSLQRFSDGEEEFECDPKNLIELINLINERHPKLKEKLCTDRGEIKNYFNVYVDGEDIRFLDNINTDLTGRKEVIIVSAVAGGDYDVKNVNRSKVKYNTYLGDIITS